MFTRAIAPQTVSGARAVVMLQARFAGTRSDAAIGGETDVVRHSVVWMGGLALALAAFVHQSALARSSIRLTQSFSANLDGFEEVPAVSTRGSGRFDADLLDDGTIAYELRYSGLEHAVTQAHIHFGQAGVNGGISVFLCTNLDNGPQGTQACPKGDGEITGVIAADDVIGPAAQGIAPGQFGELLEAMLARSTYVNVHSAFFEAGEIRGQIIPRTPQIDAE